MLRSGRVVGSEDGMLSVCFERPEMCEKCGACVGRSRNTLVRIPGDAKAGDIVDVEMPDAQVVKASAMAYLIPLIGLLGGLLIASVVTPDELLTAAGGVIGLSLAWGAMIVVDRSRRRRNTWTPRIVAVRANQQESVSDEGGQHGGNHIDQGEF